MNEESWFDQAVKIGQFEHKKWRNTFGPDYERIRAAVIMANTYRKRIRAKDSKQKTKDLLKYAAGIAHKDGRLNRKFNTLLVKYNIEQPVEKEYV